MPSGIAVSCSGCVYITDIVAHRVLVFGTDGQFQETWGGKGTGPGEFNEPTDVALDADENIYILDKGNNRVQVFDDSHLFVRLWGKEGSGRGEFVSPNGLTVDTNGRVYVADAGNKRIQVFDREGNFLVSWGAEGDNDACGFVQPMDVAVAPDDNIHVLDSGAHRVQVLSPNGDFIFSWGSFGRTRGCLYDPAFLDIGPDGSVYVSDTGNDSIQVFDSSGGSIAKWGAYDEEAGFRVPSDVVVRTDGSIIVDDDEHHCLKKLDPLTGTTTVWGKVGTTGVTGMTIDSDGNVFVVNMSGDCVKKFDPAGNLIGGWGQAGRADGQFDGPQDIALDTSGKAYVTDYGNSRVQIFGSDGHFIGKWDCGINSPPAGIAIDAADNVYVAVRDRHSIVKRGPDGAVVRQWGAWGQDPGFFYCPEDVEVDADGCVYVSDYGNSRVQKFDSEGRFLTAFGGFGSAPGLFDGPQGLAIDQAGNVYVADWANNRIQKFRPRFLPSENSPPRIDSFYPAGDTSIFSGETQLFAISKSDPDGDELTVRWIVTRESETAAEKLLQPCEDFTDEFSFAAPYGSAGKYRITVAVSDGQAETSRSWILTVVPKNWPPRFKSVVPEENVSSPEGHLILFRAEVFDPEGAPLTIQWYLDGELVAAGTMSYGYCPDYESAGEHTVCIIVSDGELMASHQWKVTVSNTNRPPVLEVIHPEGDPLIYEGESQDFAIRKFDPDGDELTVRWSVNDSSLKSLSPISEPPDIFTDKFTFMAYEGSAGVHEVKVVVSDGSLEASYTWMLTVWARPGLEFQRKVILTRERDAGTEMEVGDIDGDGDPDVIMTLGEDLCWLENRWTNERRFVQQFVGKPMYARYFCVADLDADGDQDIVSTTVSTEYGTHWFENKLSEGRGFADHSFPEYWNGYESAVGDVDRDGDMDIVVRDAGTAFGRGDLAGTLTFVVRRDPEGLDVADMDGDGDSDIVQAGKWHEHVGGRDMSAEFVTHQLRYENGGEVQLGRYVSAKAADLNGDGKMDILLNCWGSGGLSDQVEWLERVQGDVVRRHWVFEGGNYALLTVHPVDFDLDGDVDILVTVDQYCCMAEVGDDAVILLQNDGKGTFGRYKIASEINPRDICTADIDGDGDLDILVSMAELIPNDDYIMRVVVYENTSFFIRGDVDRNGKVDTEDVLTLMACLVAQTNLQKPEAADINDDGEVGLDDLVRLAKYVFGVSCSSPPASPFPTAGPDPTRGAVAVQELSSRVEGDTIYFSAGEDALYELAMEGRGKVSLIEKDTGHALTLSGDSDYDGWSDYAEMIAGTDRNDPQSLPHVIAVVSDPSNIIILLETVPGRRYRVLCSSDLRQWSPIGDAVPTLGEKTPLSTPIPLSTSRCFYKIEILP